ncbi:solute carrier family 41 member 1-like [Oratosquilla oratoria]|uniref:solute carrier family 41 member 1-like n=1 Tax=Oratosquilla oratoria TaxID=337810 RepID=UPI003F761AB3
MGGKKKKTKNVDPSGQAIGGPPEIESHGGTRSSPRTDRGGGGGGGTAQRGGLRRRKMVPHASDDDYYADDDHADDTIPLTELTSAGAKKKKKKRARPMANRIGLALSRHREDGSKLGYEGIIEEGDGLYEERSITSGSEEEQAKALLGEGDAVAELPIEEDETSHAILMQVMLPFLVAGLGMVGAGLVLDIVQHWDVFVVVSELFIMVPALLGLKGNLEMTLASRLSTHANMGHLDQRDECLSMILGNLALIQCQAIVVGFLASVAAVVMGWIPEGEFHILHALLLCASALVTASLASFILGVIMVGVILLSRKCNINPDNVATPIAASLGDLTTLGLLSWIASILYEAKTEDYWLAPLIIVGYLLSLPLWIWLASRNKHTKEVLYSGWTPVIAAMMISSMGGLILDFTVANYKGIAVYQPVINGVGGNLVAVQASRISTALHLMAPLGVMPKAITTICTNPCSAFCARSGHPRAARVLLLLVVPGHLVFVYAISYLKAGHTSLTPIFVVTYLFAAFLQVMILLYVAYVMVHWMWKVAIDPDNSAIPYLTALGDLLGTGLLAIAFHFLYAIGDGDADVGD